MFTHASSVSSTFRFSGFGEFVSSVYFMGHYMVKLLFWARVGLGLGLGTLGLASYGMYYIERWDSSPIDYIFRP